MKPCPLCRGEAWRVYYRIFPMWLCADDRCGCCFGVWTWVFHFLPFDGQFTAEDKVDRQEGQIAQELNLTLEAAKKTLDNLNKAFGAK